MHYYFHTQTNEIIGRQKKDESDLNPYFTNVQELVDSSVSSAEMLAWVNADRPADKKLKGFRTRADAAARIFKELGHLIEEELQEAQAEADNAAAAEAERKPKGRKKASEGSEVAGDASSPLPAHEAGAADGPGRGRKSPNAGKRLFSTVQMDMAGEIANPRKAGSHGYKSMAILIAAGSDGILYEEYISQGGRPQDLAWDIAHGNARVE